MSDSADRAAGAGLAMFQFQYGLDLPLLAAELAAQYPQEAA